jgi:hypothetical protein
MRSEPECQGAGALFDCGSAREAYLEYRVLERSAHGIGSRQTWAPEDEVFDAFNVGFSKMHDRLYKRGRRNMIP